MSWGGSPSPLLYMELLTELKQSNKDRELLFNEKKKGQVHSSRSRPHFPYEFYNQQTKTKPSLFFEIA